MRGVLNIIRTKRKAFSPTLKNPIPFVVVSREIATTRTKELRKILFWPVSFDPSSVILFRSRNFRLIVYLLEFEQARLI
jgi:hypothetical protein